MLHSPYAAKIWPVHFSLLLTPQHSTIQPSSIMQVSHYLSHLELGQSTLHRPALLHCNALHYIVLHCTPLHCTSLHCRSDKPKTDSASQVYSVNTANMSPLFSLVFFACSEAFLLIIIQNEQTLRLITSPFLSCVVVSDMVHAGNVQLQEGGILSVQKKKKKRFSLTFKHNPRNLLKTEGSISIAKAIFVVWVFFVEAPLYVFFCLLCCL